MSTKYPELFAALAQPFPPEEVKQKPGQGKQVIHFITARTAMNRLDAVLGPENWKDEFTETKEGLKCRLSIRLPDGEWLPKEDGGGFAGMKAADDNEKSAYSDAFKRAAAKFGVARYLYRDGVPDYVPAPAREPERLPANGRPRPTHPQPWSFALDSWLRRWDGFDPIIGLVPSTSPNEVKSKEQVSREHRIAHELVTAAISDECQVKDAVLTEARIAKPAEAGKEPVRDPAKVWAAVKALWVEQPSWCEQAVSLYLKDKEEALAIRDERSAPAIGSH